MPSWEQGDPARPPGAPIPGLHLPGDRSQSHSSLRPFRTAPFSPATVGGGPGPLQTRAEDGGAGLPLESLCPPGTCPYFPKSPVPSCSPGGASGHKALIILSSFCLMWGDLPQINAQPKGIGFYQWEVRHLQSRVRVKWWKEAFALPSHQLSVASCTCCNVIPAQWPQHLRTEHSAACKLITQG